MPRPETEPHRAPRPRVPKRACHAGCRWQSNAAHRRLSLGEIGRRRTGIEGDVSMDAVTAEFQTDQDDRNEQHNSERYARCIAASKRIRWDIDRDVIRGRSFDFTRKFLPDVLSKVD